jgi:ABC-2 type transport system permease protein
LAGEEELGRLELILVTPVSRIRFAMEKAAALTVSTMILGLVIFAFLWLAIIMVDADVPITELAAAMTAVTLLGMEHGLVAMAVGLATGRKSWAVATASMMALGGYVLYAAGEFLSSIQRYQMLSPIFHALEGGPVGGGFRVSLIFMPLIGVLALALTLHRFDVRDIRT